MKVSRRYEPLVANSTDTEKWVHRTGMGSGESWVVPNIQQDSRGLLAEEFGQLHCNNGPDSWQQLVGDQRFPCSLGQGKTSEPLVGLVVRLSEPLGFFGGTTAEVRSVL